MESSLELHRNAFRRVRQELQIFFAIQGWDEDQWVVRPNNDEQARECLFDSDSSSSDESDESSSDEEDEESFSDEEDEESSDEEDEEDLEAAIARQDRMNAAFQERLNGPIDLDDFGELDQILREMEGVVVLDPLAEQIDEFEFAEDAGYVSNSDTDSDDEFEIFQDGEFDAINGILEDDDVFDMGLFIFENDEGYDSDPENNEENNDEINDENNPGQ